MSVNYITNILKKYYAPSLDIKIISLTYVSWLTRKVLSPAQIITGYEIVLSNMEPTLMVTIDGETIFEDTLININ